MFALTIYAFPMRAYLQANVGTTAAVDDEIEVCTAL